MATSIDQKNFVKTALRLPPELHAAVHEAAQKSGRSYNAELLERVQRSFEVDEKGEADEMLYEMRKTQLHLELNTIALQLNRVREEENSLFDREPEDEGEAMERESALSSLRIRKKDLDIHMANALGRLDELKRQHERAKPKS